MSRPKPHVLLDYTNPKTYDAEQVLKADAIYAVFYDGKPINLRSLNVLRDYPGPKYKKVSFSNPGHASISPRAQPSVQDDKFEVFRMAEGEKVSEDRP